MTQFENKSFSFQHSSKHGAAVGAGEAGKQVSVVFVCRLNQRHKVNGNRLWQNCEHPGSDCSENNSLLPEQALLQ